MVRKLLFAAAAVLVSITVSAQENEVKRLPEIDNRNEYREYSRYDRGFFFAAELMGGYSCRVAHSNFAFTEIDAVGGYRFNEFLQVGAGIGARYYFDNNAVRYTSIKWAGPVYVNVRGSIIPSDYRNVVPYYSVDVGGTIRDGFMIRPSFGIRVGEPRSAFLLALGYMAQDLTGFTFTPTGEKAKDNRVVSFITLKVGYQF